MKKLLLTLLGGVLCCLNLMAEVETIFSLQTKPQTSAAIVSDADNTDLVLTSTHATIVGGTATVHAKAKANTQLTKGSSSTPTYIYFNGAAAYLKIDLANGKTLAVGDVITYESKDQNNLCFTTSSSRTTDYSATNTSTTQTYVVKEGDALVGTSTIYVWRATGNTTNAASTLTITRTTAGATDDATLSEIVVNGKALRYVSDNMTYVLPYGTSSVPVVDATTNSAKANANITQATSTSGTATIKVTAEDGETTKDYSIAFSVQRLVETARSWDLSSVVGNSAKQAEVTGATKYWTSSSSGRYATKVNLSDEQLPGASDDLSFAKGLYFTGNSGQLLIGVTDSKNKYLQMNATNQKLRIPGCKKGDVITIAMTTASSGKTPSFTSDQIEGGEVLNGEPAVVSADGDVILSVASVLRVTTINVKPYNPNVENEWTPANNGEILYLTKTTIEDENAAYMTFSNTNYKTDLTIDGSKITVPIAKYDTDVITLKLNGVAAFAITAQHGNGTAFRSIQVKVGNGVYTTYSVPAGSGATTGVIPTGTTESVTVNISGNGADVYVTRLIAYTSTNDLTMVNAPVNATVGYGTFYCDYEVSKPANTQAYTAVLDENVLKLTEIEGTVIPAKTAVILTGDGGEFKYSNTGATFSGANDLVGIATAKQTETVTGGTVCVLGYEDEKAGFYQYTGAILGANKAYLVVPSAASVKGGLSIVFDDNTTAVAGVAEAKAEVKTVKFVKNGQLLIKTANGIINAAAAQVK